MGNFSLPQGCHGVTQGRSLGRRPKEENGAGSEWAVHWSGPGTAGLKKRIRQGSEWAVHLVGPGRRGSQEENRVGSE